MCCALSFVVVGCSLFVVGCLLVAVHCLLFVVVLCCVLFAGRVWLVVCCSLVVV